MAEQNLVLSATDVVSLGDEKRAGEVLSQAILGLWQVVNNLTRLRRTAREDFRWSELTEWAAELARTKRNGAR